jgi:hypothetical protein
MIDYLKYNYDTHLAAVTSGGLALSGTAIVQAILVGVGVFIITNLIKLSVVEIRKKLCRKSV